MSVVRFLKLSEIRRRTDARPLVEGAVQSLAESIRDVGLLSPVVVRPVQDGAFELIAGNHRLAAHELLGETEIRCQEAEYADDLRAELAALDENLIRSEVAGILRDQQIARRKEIYETLHPETRLGENQHTRVRQFGEPSPADRFTAETAALTGVSERSIQRSVERGEKIVPEAATLISGTPLDRGVYRDELKEVPAAEQVEKVRRDLSGGRPAAPKRARPAASTATEPKAQAAMGDAFARFIALTDDLASLRAGEIVSVCPPQKRADLSNRVRSFLDLLEEIDSLMENRT